MDKPFGSRADGEVTEGRCFRGHHPKGLIVRAPKMTVWPRLDHLDADHSLAGIAGCEEDLRLSVLRAWLNSNAFRSGT